MIDGYPEEGYRYDWWYFSCHQHGHTLLIETPSRDEAIERVRAIGCCNGQEKGFSVGAPANKHWLATIGLDHGNQETSGYVDLDSEPASLKRTLSYNFDDGRVIWKGKKP